MRKLFIVGLLVCSSAQAEIKTNKTSQSFLFTRPVFNNLPSNTSLWHDSWFDVEKKSAFQVTTQYQQSFNSGKLKRYFLMADRDKLVVRGSAHGNYSNTDTDVRSEWLGLPGDFQGTLSIAPEQWQLCWNMSARRSLPNFTDSKIFSRMWAFIDLPLVVMKNKMNFKQETVTGAAASTVAVRDIETAFQNSNWNYQKMKTTSSSSTHLGQVRIGFGKTFISNDRAHAATYSALTIPSCAKQKNKYLFEPQAGFNGHLGMIWGASFQVPLTRKSDVNSSSLFLEFENTYLIRNFQNRTFDLKNKEWSRFLLMRLKDQTTNLTTPGVNVLTKKVRVSPYAIIDVSGGMRFNVGLAQAEIGIGAWGHNTERLRLNETWKENYGIAGSTTNTSASASTIKTVGSNDATFTPIKETDLDLDSAASLATVLYRAHASIGARGRGENSNALFGCGAFIEIPRNNTKALSQWGAWVKAGGAF